VVGLVALILFGAAAGGLYLWASHEFRLAREDVERYHYNDAKTHLQLCLRVWPNDPDTLLLAARVARRLRAYGLANEYLDGYLRVRGEDDNLIVERALLRAERGDLDAVSRFCFSLVKQGHPDTPLILEALSAGYIRMYRLKDADVSLGLWLDQQPDNTQALMFRGLIQELQAMQQEAAPTYRRVLELDPEQDEARLRLAGLLVDLTQAPEALTQLEYLRRRLPDNPMVLVDLARCHDLLGQQPEAEQVLDELLDRVPSLTPALTQRAILAIRADRLDQAERLLRRAAATSPGDYQAHYQLSLCLRLRGQTKEAQAVQGQLKQIEDDNKRLREIITYDMPQNPHKASLHHEMGMIALRAGALNEAMRWFESALREDPEFAPTHRALALFYERMGQRGRALRELELAGPAPADAPAGGTEKTAGP
jgi:tetratricopeptide (TPR) repeat protein